MGYMKEAFESWIKVTPRDNGTSYSKETISGYVSSLKTHASKLSDLKLNNTDLFNLDNIEAFDRVYDQIKNSAFFDEINKSYHRIFQVHYRFIEGSYSRAHCMRRIICYRALKNG